MMNTGLKLVILFVTVLFLAACSSSKTKDDATQTRANVEERGTANATSTDDEDGGGAVTQGLDDDDPYSLAALDDPESQLAVRIIYFDYDSATIRSDFADTIAAHANFLAHNPGSSVTLEGHADERGSREYNLALGERRALAVRRQLVLLGASAGQIKTVSYGEERPVEDGHDESSYSLNRRVELVY